MFQGLHVASLGKDLLYVRKASCTGTASGTTFFLPHNTEA